MKANEFTDQNYSRISGIVDRPSIGAGDRDLSPEADDIDSYRQYIVNNKERVKPNQIDLFDY